MKKVLSLIVALSMLFALAAPAFAADGETGYSDVDGTIYEGPVSVLRNLGIMTGYEDGSFHPYATITRAEMAAIGLHMRGIFDYGANASIEEVQYEDMDGHWAEAVVAYARSLGLIDGYEDGNFYPDDKVTYEQAIKIVIAALGYDHYATLNGGYPQGYLNKASSLKLTKGVGLTVGSYITRGDVAKIVYNSLTVDLMNTVYYNDTDIAYQVAEGENILNTYFDVAKLTGIVEANDRTGLYGVPTSKEGTVKIGNELFDAGDTGIADYLGYYVTFYALEDTSLSERIIVSYNVESSKNNYIKLDADKIENVTLTSSKYVFEYESGKTTKSIKTSENPLVIYNGVALTDYIVSDLAPENGQVTLLDNDGNGSYDIIEVLSYDIMFVLNASQSTGNVSAACSTGLRSIQLDTDSDDYTVRIMDKDGNNVPFSTIRQNSVISIAVSRDEAKSVRTVIVSNDSINGTIDGVSSSKLYTISGKEYELVGYMHDVYDISMGSNGTFYLDINGRLAGFDGEVKNNKNIAMFIESNNSSNNSSKKEIKIVNADGSIATYGLASKVRLNGEAMGATEVFSLIEDEEDPLFGNLASESSKAGKIIADPAKAGFLYKLNKEGRISEIVTATATYGTEAAKAAELSEKWASQSATIGGYNNFYYSTKYRCFHRSDIRTYVADDTVIFFSDDKESKTNDSQIYSTRTAGSFYNNQNFYYNSCYFYYIGDKGYADFAIFYDGYDLDISGVDTSINTGVRNYAMYDSIRVVDRIVEMYNHSDDAKYEIDYSLVFWEKGKSRTVDFHEDKADLAMNSPRTSSATPKLVRGDMINYVLTSGKITDLVSIFNDSNSWNRRDDGANGTGADYRYHFNTGTTEFWANYDYYYNSSLVQRYLLGRVTSIDTLKYFSTFDLDTGDWGSLTSEPLEGSCYRLVYSNDGKVSDVEDVGIDALAPDQLVLMRKNGTSGQLGCRVVETYILYEFSEFTDLQKSWYSSIYADVLDDVDTLSVDEVAIAGDEEIAEAAYTKQDEELETL